MTAVVAASGADAAWLGECLDSLRAQTHRNLEILVVLYGEPRGSAGVAAHHAGEDWRVRVVADGGPSAGSARNLGGRRALGRFTCFVAATDVVPPTGVRLLVKALDRSGSDLAIGRALQLPAARSVEAAGDPAHDSYRERVTLQDFPLAVADLSTGNRLFRTDFWRRSGLAFPEQAAPGQRPLATDAFVASRSFDLLPDVTYHEMRRAGGVPFGAMQDAMAELDAWLVDQHATWSTLGGADATAVRDAWAFVVCDDWAQRFVDDVERATKQQWHDLRAFLGSVVEQVGPRMWSRVRAENRVKLRLLVDDRRAELEDFLSRRWFELGNRPTEVVDGEVRARLPFHDRTDLGVPASDFVMSESETALTSV
ncbi:MAG: glycosyltransferase family 2 protein, partial [Nocardioides sp.]